MSVKTLMDTMKAENDFCSICLRTKTEVKLDLISTKMYQMFFVGLVKCTESKQVSRKICVWCRRRVVNALKLVEIAQTTDRILASITQIDKPHSQSSKQIVWDQIQATKRTHGLTPRISRIISYSLPLDTEISSPMKLEHEDGISGKEKNVGLDSLINKVALDHTSKRTYIPISRTSQVISCELSPDAGIGVSVKLECEDGIFNEEENVCFDGAINESELALKEWEALEGHVDVKLETKMDDEVTSELDVEENTPCLSEGRKMNNPKSNVVMKKTMKEMESNKTVYIEISKLEPIEADGNQSSISEVINESPSMEFGELVTKNDSQGDKSRVEVKGSDTNSQTTNALKHIRLLQLTEAQRLQDLEERRQEIRYRNAAFKCELCALNFTFCNTYEAHMERHSENFGSHKCTICGMYVKEIKSYRRHCKNHYERYECTVCGFICQHKKDALAHYLSQHTNERYKCEHCKSEFRTALILKQHIKTVHNVERPLFPCPCCSQVLSTKYSYDMHVLRHNRGVPRLHRCEVCSRTFQTAARLRQHQTTHSKEKTFHCQLCGKGLKALRTLKAHMERKHSNVCFECDYCQKIFGLKGDLRLHIIWKHLGRGYKCQLCPKVLRSNYLLERHVKQDHEGWTEPKDRVCEVCGKGFSRKDSLKIHRRIHSTERPYHCTACSATFKHSSALEKHKRRVCKINK